MEDTTPPPEVSSDLTERQIAVLTDMARGLSNPEIAANQHLSLRTVEREVNALSTALGIDNRVALALKAYRGGIIDDANLDTGPVDCPGGGRPPT